MKQLIEEAFSEYLLKQEGKYDDPKYYDGFGNRMGGASDEGEDEYTPPKWQRFSKFVVYIGKKRVKDFPSAVRANGYANAIRKKQPSIADTVFVVPEV